MRIQRVRGKKIQRADLDGYESLQACELREMMISNDGSEIAKTLNNLDPAIKLLYAVYQWCLDRREDVVKDNG